MGTIVLHAGRHKTGSSSIQRWLRDNAVELRERSGIVALHAEVEPGGELRLVPNEGRKSMNSWQVMEHWRSHPDRRDEIVTQLGAELDRHAAAAALVVLSAESLGYWFSRLEEPVAMLAGLAEHHELRIAYYVRPQHSALEALWRARGFRGEQPPSDFLRDNSRYDYLRTLRHVRATVPAIGFEPRPYRRDLLVAGNAVVDFAHAFLGLELDDGESKTMWLNPSLPLELANALRGSADLLATELGSDANPMRVLRRLVGRLGPLPESERVRLSRLVLQQACHERFEAGNRELIAELGWPTESWVPAVEEDIGEASFERLDELWRPSASPAELALLHAAVERLVSLPAAR